MSKLHLSKLKEKCTAENIVFVISLVLMVVFAATFLLMPKASSVSLNEGNDKLLYAVGGTFWGSLLVSNVLMLVVTVLRRKSNVKLKCKKVPGIIAFFSNKEAMIADIATAVFAIAFIVGIFTAVSKGYLIYVFLFFLVLSFEAHCVLNGKNYAYIKEHKVRGDVK